jgi:putative Holliday junction resolvase
VRGAAPGRWLALDVGERRVGIAISDPTGLLASPLATLHRKSKLEDFQRIARLVQEREAIGLVVGWPLHMNGTESPQARRVRRYSEALKATLRDQGFEGPVVLWDERPDGGPRLMRPRRP